LDAGKGSVMSAVAAKREGGLREDWSSWRGAGGTFCAWRRQPPGARLLPFPAGALEPRARRVAADARGEKASGGRGLGGRSQRSEERHAAQRPPPADMAEHVGFAECQDKGRLVQRSCARSCGLVFRAIGRDGPIPGVPPGSRPDVTIAATILYALRAQHTLTGSFVFQAPTSCPGLGSEASRGRRSRHRFSGAQAGSVTAVPARWLRAASGLAGRVPRSRHDSFGGGVGRALEAEELARRLDAHGPGEPRRGGSPAAEREDRGRSPDRAEHLQALAGIGP